MFKRYLRSRWFVGFVGSSGSRCIGWRVGWVVRVLVEDLFLCDMAVNVHIVCSCSPTRGLSLLQLIQQ